MAEQFALISEKQNNGKSGFRPSRRFVGALTSLFGTFRHSTNATKHASARQSLTEKNTQTRDPHKAEDVHKLHPFPNDATFDAPTIQAAGGSTMEENFQLLNKEEAQNMCGSEIVRGGSPMEENSELLNKEEAQNMCGSDIVRGSVMGRESLSFAELQLLIRRLQQGGCAEIQANVAETIRHAAKDSADVRITLAKLGAIPPLVACLDSSHSSCQSSALLALLNLAICNDDNKLAIVGAGAVKKIVHLLSTNEVAVQEAAVAALLSISALDANKSIIGASGAVPLFVNMLKNGSFQGRKDTLRALYNLSICSKNVHIIVESGATRYILDMVSEPEVADIALALIGLMADTEIGRKELNSHKDIVLLLVTVLGWRNIPTCQERGLYVLMLIAHHSWVHRQALVDAGAISLLLQLVLLGSELSQRRASRILDYLRDDRIQTRAVSAPMPTGLQQQHLEDLDAETSKITDERQIINQMVQQSLQRSMNRLVKRACVQSVSIGPNSSTRTLRNSSRSKSLQF